MEIGIVIEKDDVLTIRADVLVFKYAQMFHSGPDALAFSELATVHRDLDRKLPKPKQFLLLESQGSLPAQNILFSGVVEIERFRYNRIRDFSFRSLEYLSKFKPDAEHICFTLHGVNYGLDEKEAFEAEIAGLADAIGQGFYPAKLRKISIVEYYEPRAERLKQVLARLLPEGSIKAPDQPVLASRNTNNREQLISNAGIRSEEKPLIFIAMPFDKKMDDIFHYGIQNAVNHAGFLCERADLIAFTGDILDLVKRRIGEASLVIADLTSTNANVYLEVGYAWGLGKSTILIAQDAQELKFDVKGQKCIIYSSIKELEEKLGEELLGLKKKKRHDKSP